MLPCITVVYFGIKKKKKKKAVPGSSGKPGLSLVYTIHKRITDTITFPSEFLANSYCLFQN